MKTAIRMDDITPDMDLEKFHRVKKILDTYQIKPLIGVVPFNEDSNLKRNSAIKDFKVFLTGLKNEGYTIALHGCYHVYTTGKKGLFPLNNFSEYAGIPYDEQVKMLEKGKRQLLDWGIDTDIFMAPAHTFDRSTLHALEKTGFRAVTDGFGAGPYIRSGLVFYPIAKKRMDCFSDREGYTTLVLHANTMEEEDFATLEKQICENVGKFISYSEYLKVPPSRRSVAGNLVEYLLAFAKYVLVRIRK